MGGLYGRAGRLTAHNGGFRPGQEELGACVDHDECIDANPCGEHGKCNAQGDLIALGSPPACTCNRGYEGETCQTDIDEVTPCNMRCFPATF
jgi:hypothetical protein